MSTRRYTASKTPTKNGTGWTMSFRHPLRLDARGNQGRKVRRGLGTEDEAQAQELVNQMNELLGDPSWHSIGKRDEAERHFPRIVVCAFYDGIEAPPSHASRVIRDAELPLPTADEGYAHVMMVGATGAGKTTLLRQLIGSDPKRDRFPSTSTSRTTIADIEVITSDEPTFRAVVTFFDEPTIRTYVDECVAAACAELWNDIPDETLANRLLTHRDLRFRLGYIIGSWKQTGTDAEETDDGWDYDEGETDTELSDVEDDGTRPTTLEVERMQEKLRVFLKRIRALADAAKQQLQDDLNVDLSTLDQADREAARELFEEIVEETVWSFPDFGDLVDDIMAEIKLRFHRHGAGTLDTHPGGWLKSWRYETEDRAAFVRAVRRFSSNYAAAFGTLLTPLVDGIRIRGPLFPTFTDRRPKLVLLDGEGLGHVEDPAAGIALRIAKRFNATHVILLVDTAKAPMLEAPTSVLRAIAASGYQKKLAIAFTHFDLMHRQDNLLNFEARREHVLSSVNQRLGSLKEVVGQPAVRAMERDLVKDRCFMLGHLDRPLTEKHKGPVGQMLQLLDFCESAIEKPEPVEIHPVYVTENLVLAIQAATRNFHDRWSVLLGFERSSNIRTPHWAEVKALTRRVALNMDDGEYKDLKPVADLVARLSETITRFLDKPIRWDPGPSTDAEAEEAALSRVQRAVFSRLHEFVEKRLLSTPRKQWITAYEYRGRGSTRARANEIRTIYDASAPIPGSAHDSRSEEFLRDVRLLVHKAIGEGDGRLVTATLSPSEDAIPHPVSPAPSRPTA